MDVKWEPKSDTEVDVADGTSSVRVPPPLPSHVSPLGQQPPVTQYSPDGQYVPEPSSQQTPLVGMQLCSQTARPSELHDPEPDPPESTEVVGVETATEVGSLKIVIVPPPLPSHVSPLGQQPPVTQYSPNGQYVEEPSSQQTASVGMQLSSQVA